MRERPRLPAALRRWRLSPASVCGALSDTRLRRPLHAQKSGGARKAGGKAASGKGAAASSSAAAEEEAGPLDPLAEKFRLQRLQEASDFEAARAAFGGAGQNLDELCPKTESVRLHPPPCFLTLPTLLFSHLFRQDFTEYGDVLYFKYLRPFEARARAAAARPHTAAQHSL